MAETYDPKAILGAQLQKLAEAIATDLNGKVDKVPAATAGNIVVFNSTGNIASAGKKVGDLVNHGKYTYVQSSPGAGEFSDWNQLTVDGIYSIPNSPEAGTANSPEEDKMTLIVMTSTDSQDRTLCVQLAVGDEMYVRKKTYSGGWDSSWTQVTRQTWANWVITNTSGITYNMLKAALDAGRAVYLVGYVSNRSYILKATEFSVSQNSVVLFTGITSTGMLATTKCTVQEGWDSNITVSGLPWDGYHLSIGGTPTAGTNTIYFT